MEEEGNGDDDDIIHKYFEDFDFNNLKNDHPHMDPNIPEENKSEQE